MHRIRRSLLSALVVALALVAPVPTAASEPVVVGVFASLTGPQASFGEAERRGVELAVDEINRRGGVLGGRELRVLVEDDHSRVEDAAEVVTKLVTEDRVVAVLGEVASSDTLAAAPICQTREIPLLTPASTNVKVTRVGDYVFRGCFVDARQGEALATFAAGRLNAKRVAVMRDTKSDYSTGLARTIASAFEARGGTVAGVVEYSQGDADFRAQIRAIKRMKVDALFVPGYYNDIGLIVRQARAAGIEVPVLAGDGASSEALFDIGGEALRDTYVADHVALDGPWPESRAFVAAFEAKYGAEPDSNAALSYDAARLLADAIGRAGSTEGPAIRDALAATNGFASLTGPMSFDDARDAVRPVVIVKVGERAGRPAFVYVDALP